MRLIDADELIKKAHCESRGLTGAYSDLGMLVEWLVDKTLTIEPDPDTVSRQAVYDTLTEYYHHKTDIQHKALAEALSLVPLSPTSSRPQEPHTASLETPCDDCDFTEKCTYESNCPREAIWKAGHEGGAA